jgi:hypothetical protein
MKFRTVGRSLYPLVLLALPVLTVSVCWVVSRSHGATTAMSSLRQAAVANNVPAARALLDSGCPVNTTADGGPTPLAWAAVAGHTEMASFLLSRGADLHLGSLHDGRSPCTGRWSAARWTW